MSGRLGSYFQKKIKICGLKEEVKAFKSPAHKRTEGRAPVWGSEFTSKDAALQGGIQHKPLLG